MNLTLSYAEAQASVRRLLGLADDVNVTISRKPKPKKSTDEFSGLPPLVVRLVRFIDATHDKEKITAIKELRGREYLGLFPSGVALLGLRDAKDIVENWKEVRPLILKNKRIPIPSYKGFDLIGFQQS